MAWQQVTAFCVSCDKELDWTCQNLNEDAICENCQETEKQEIRRKMREKQDSTCKHTEDVCQHCLEKVETKTEVSPLPKQTLPFGSKLLLTSAVSAFLVASGALWLVNTKSVLTAAKMAVKLIGTPTE